MHNNSQSYPHPWPVIGLAILPGATYILARLVFALDPGRELSGWLPYAATFLSSTFVIAAALWRERRFTLWSLPSIGTGIVSLSEGTIYLLNRGLPAIQTASYQPPAWYTTGRTILDITVVILFIGVLALGVWSGRRWGGAAGLLASGFIGWVAFGFMDPTYGLSIMSPETYTALGVLLLDSIPLVLFLMVLPVAVLRARAKQEQVARLLGGFALFLASMVLISLLHAFAVQGVLGARPLIVELGYTLALGPLVAGVFWVILAGLTFVCKLLDKNDGGIQPGEAAASA